MGKKKYKYRKQFTYNGQTFEVYADTLDELIEKRDKRAQKAQERRISVREWSTVCFTTYRPNASESTIYASKMRFEKHVFPVIGNKDISNVKPIELQEILNSQKGKSKSHIDKLTQELFFVFDKAVDNGYIKSNPAKNIFKPDAKAGRRRTITKEERAVLSDLVQDPQFFAFALMLYCGLRPSEVRGLLWSDFVEIDGFNYVHVRGTKTANSDRFVPLCVEIMDIIEKTPKTAEYCVTTSTGHYHYAASWKRLVKRLKREMDIKLGAKLYRNQIIESKLADDFTPYLLRHTFCSDLQKKGIDVRTASKLMGHADIRTTVNIYTHTDEETLKEAAEKMGQSIPTKIPT